ncbi:DUF4097 family beta strand repeat protein [Nonomuraea sp. SMC257]|uniref:DUF4097 family beta strand repeat protein n=1 Tax=Nonomuraea montanisoli TaxID=2741721 RepID=A0A7Y6M8L5_9ACTN|nr:DUF4097 family beta strand repeat-containing protein [Nonomuraea montanisoli]NUW37519.1 DUF4097 family beta strand repeat protein [Nonomuraea montanisoli]
MKTIVIAGGLLASTALLTGCGLQSLAGPTNQDTVDYQVTDKVSRLQVKSGSGDVAVTEYDGTAVRVTETIQWRDNKPKTEHKVEGDTLLLTYTCGSGIKGWGDCDVNYKVEVPKGLAVTVKNGSGDITLRSLTGTTEVSTGSGDIDGTGLGAKSTIAEAGSGGVELKYVAAPDSVQVDAGSGDIGLRVPDGSYAVTTKTGSGDENISVKDDDSSPRKLTLEAGSGDITVSPA